MLPSHNIGQLLLAFYPTLLYNACLKKSKRDVRMARVTIEDCLTQVDNRFQLILVASRRARQLANGKVEPTVAPENDKPTVLALREIAAGNVGKAILDEPEVENRVHSYDIPLSQHHGFNTFW